MFYILCYSSGVPYEKKFLELRAAFSHAKSFILKLPWKRNQAMYECRGNLLVKYAVVAV